MQSARDIGRSETFILYTINGPKRSQNPFYGTVMFIHFKIERIPLKSFDNFRPTVYNDQQQVNSFWVGEG
jgi:hypothetical protein